MKELPIILIIQAVMYILGLMLNDFVSALIERGIKCICDNLSPLSGCNNKTIITNGSPNVLICSFAGHYKFKINFNFKCL
jgi:hypothetical protein